MTLAQEKPMDFGFNSEEFTGTEEVIPYAQFINPVRSENWGIGIKKSCAEAAKFQPDSNWNLVQHKFGDGNREEIYLCQKPRLIILARSGALMGKDGQVTKYNAQLKSQGWKSFSYAIVFFLSEQNELLSESPFRLKCSGQAGISFIKNYSHYSNQECFTNKFLICYQRLTGDKNRKNQLFFSHAVYVPYLKEGEAFNRDKTQSSPACLTEGYLEPIPENLVTLIIKNATYTSDLIKQAIEATADWIKHESIAETERTIQEEVFDANSSIPPVYKEAIQSQGNGKSNNGNGGYSRNGQSHYPNNSNGYSSNNENGYTSQITNSPTAVEGNLDSIPF